MSLTTVSYNGMEVTFREVGSTLSPMWPSYHSASVVVIFAVDCSTFQNAAEVACELTSLFRDLQSFPEPRRVVVVLNKVDLSCGGEVAELATFLRIDELCEGYAEHFGESVVSRAAAVLVMSATDLSDCHALLADLVKNAAPSKP